jgi:hypothetical protein
MSASIRPLRLSQNVSRAAPGVMPLSSWVIDQHAPLAESGVLELEGVVGLGKLDVGLGRAVGQERRLRVDVVLAER